ncbi:39S ribosomal protein L9, mitochondrial [Onychomys torridus]|uniref:39S ribosomal protein L9, mitochondrial n=1 Tax=Onychomys torridus TaxID=38674 RepID=UPI00167F9E96|nr:39S ribosomal protein L9, mitochondrial [Onychomys torridus]
MAASVAPRSRALLWAGAAWLRQGGVGELLRARTEGVAPGRDFSLSHYRSTVIVERWWKVPLAAEGRKPRLHRRHRVYKLVEDTKHRPQDPLELILTQSVDEIGVRGDLVSVKKSVGRNKLLPQGLAVYASPENKKLFEEEKLLRQQGKLEKIQTKAGEATVKFLRSCHLEVGMKNNVKWELNPDIVARHFFKNLGVVVAPHALKLPEDPITRWGEYWCDVTVNGLDTVRVPMSVVLFQKPKTKRYKHWLAQQAAKTMAPTSSQAV